MNSVETKFSQWLREFTDGDLEFYTPGLKVQAYLDGRKKIDLSFGKTFRYYDLASLTKMIFTVPAIIRLLEQEKLKLKQDIRCYLPWWSTPGVTTQSLLTHTSGLPWWMPLYKKLKGPRRHQQRWEQMKDLVRKTPLKRQKRSVYSDVGFLVLGCLIEELNEASLVSVWKDLSQRSKFQKIHFNENNQLTYKKSQYAPTEKCPWRKKTLRGEVHDDNAWALGGVSTHAGLFGSIDDVSGWGLELRKGYHAESGSKVGSQTLIKKFAKRAIPATRGDWGLGWMKPTRNVASCGRYFSSSSIGGLGFTGTSLWWDPKKDLLVTILSNRVHPTRKNPHFRELRPIVHNLIWEALRG